MHRCVDVRFRGILFIVLVVLLFGGYFVIRGHFYKNFYILQGRYSFRIFNPAMATKLVRQCRYCQNHFLGPSVHQLTPRLNFNVFSKNNAKSAKEIKEEDIRADVDTSAKRSVKVFIFLDDDANKMGRRLEVEEIHENLVSGLYRDRVGRVV